MAQNLTNTQFHQLCILCKSESEDRIYLVLHCTTYTHIRDKHLNTLQLLHSLIQSCRSCYATQHLCQRSFYKIIVKFRNSNKNVLKIVLIIVNINKDENKSLISNQFSLKNDFPPTFWRTILQR
jgi:hypothetical protein